MIKVVALASWEAAALMSCVQLLADAKANIAKFKATRRNIITEETDNKHIFHVGSTQGYLRIESKMIEKKRHEKTHPEIKVLEINFRMSKLEGQPLGYFNSDLFLFPSGQKSSSREPAKNQ